MEPDTVNTGVGKVLSSLTPLNKNSFLYHFRLIQMIPFRDIDVFVFGGVMQIKLNGKTITTDCRSLSHVIRETEYDPSSLIAEVNFEVIREPLWSETVINDGDQIELLSFVGGG